MARVTDPAGPAWLHVVDIGPRPREVTELAAELLGVEFSAAAERLHSLPCPLRCYPSRSSARADLDRLRGLEAVGILMPGERLESSVAAVDPVDDAGALPVRRLIRRVLWVLVPLQLGIAWIWFLEGRTSTALFGLLLALCTACYLLLAK